MIIFYKGDYQNDNNELYIFHETNGLGCFIYRYHLYFSPLVHPDSHQSCANHFNESGSVYQSLYTVVERSPYKLYPLSSLRNLRASGILRLLWRNRQTCRSYRRISGRIYILDFNCRIFYENLSKEKDSDDSWHGTRNGCHLYLWNTVARRSDGAFLYRRLIRRSPSLFAWRRRQNCRRLHSWSDITEPSLFYPR